MSRDPRLRDLGAFLRARRGDVRPAAAGLDEPTRRRQIAGLRREEVAALAHITTEYYTRIEQGRMAPSRELLQRLGTVLRLDSGQLRYALALLPGTGPAPPAGGSPAVGEPLSRLLRRLVDVPALVIGPHTAILDWNEAAVALFIDFAEVPRPERTYVHLIFSNPLFQSRFRDLPAMRETVVGILRAGMPTTPAAGTCPSPAVMLAEQNADFHAIWNRHEVTQPREAIAVPLHHPVDGDILVDQIVLQSTDDANQRVLLFTARQPGDLRNRP